MGGAVIEVREVNTEGLKSSIWMVIQITNQQNLAYQSLNTKNLFLNQPSTLYDKWFDTPKWEITAPTRTQKNLCVLVKAH